MNRKKISYFSILVGMIIMVSPFIILGGTGDGSVVSITKILDNGPDTMRFNIIIMGDGYQSGEMSTFITKAQDFVNAFTSEPIFGPCGDAVNIYRVNISSTDSGVDKPTACYGDAAVYRNTYLDTYYCASGTQRCIWSSNTLLVQSTAASATPNWNFIVVLVNDTEYGGCAGSGMTFNSTGPNFERIVMHELGHAIGGLADEYEEFSNTYSGVEPSQANITKETNRAAVKWYDLILSTTPVPTWQKSDCTAFSSPASTWDNIVGTYEGGNRSYTCGIYRPTPNCKMRNLNYNFCAVCARRMQKVLMVNYGGSNLSITPWGYFLNPPSAPYWQTPDIWCDNNGNNVQEWDEPSIGKTDNHLFARITNTGSAPSVPYQVRFSYVPFTGVIDLANEQLIGVVNRPALTDGGIDTVEIIWDLTTVPPEFSGIDHFCVIVEIISGECVTYDNRAQNNFNNIPTVSPAPARVSFFIKNILEVDAVGSILITPKAPLWEFTSNIQDLTKIPLGPKEEKLITIDCKYLGKCREATKETVKIGGRKNRVGICAKEKFDFSFQLNNQILGGVTSEILVSPKVKKGKLWHLSFHLGKTFPTGRFGILYNSGFMIGADLGYRIMPRLFLVGLFDYNGFVKGSPIMEDTYWWNLSVNLKYEFSSTRLRPYINGGAGMYFPKTGDIKPGINGGLGFDYSINGNWVLELGSDCHLIFTGGNGSGFITCHGGFIFGF